MTLHALRLLEGLLFFLPCEAVHNSSLGWRKTPLKGLVSPSPSSSFRHHLVSGAGKKVQREVVRDIPFTCECPL